MKIKDITYLYNSNLMLPECQSGKRCDQTQRDYQNVVSFYDRKSGKFMAVEWGGKNGTKYRMRTAEMTAVEFSIIS